MIIKTSALTRAALNWAVLTSLGGHPIMRHTHMREKAKSTNYTGNLDWHLSMQRNNPITVTPDGVTEPLADYCADWAEGGPIIEREFDNGLRLSKRSKTFVALYIYSIEGIEYCGPTLLIAAMRCYVASKLGDEVEILEEFL